MRQPEGSVRYGSRVCHPGSVAGRRRGNPGARPLSSSARCARPACPRSGARPTKFSSERPRADRGTQVSD